ncbi:glycosyltransferase family 1 protein [Candidatus Methylacidiphilum fumarolicum]|uniref:Glycosyltransferase n=2 Tax=Candidatus Methylacidiphilum fumarolicum TaxID=591154 RepID=I0JYY4_METFB|nr:glycosyltransferase family 4 protein [Candidatus Methylacidiphilum fumarolicum]MBW6414624.1 glycosyltransferase family 4 protein [Candidatus Methylacidiphilum fumarolicum]TFE65640.1 glycosyl transferase [Candidatus Methylacidiphilum fumarolicum]TFE74194.1 glycosyltransferase family 1 protein [Candidatus Methylacidiphilum fumarolicum]TFE75693.1 glycosyltransferase family 1 protein [Candidatus Methylacidiphilum fumarolicum]TFE75852.1 glycosyl transferase [Candidatus Methylacidiphilum fumaroli
MSTPKVNIAVCGRFHYHNYVPFLAKEGILNFFYYSHRFDRKILSGGQGNEVNLWLKEYLIRIHHRLLSTHLLSFFAPFYNSLWEKQLLRHWKAAKLWHIMLHGSARDIIHKVCKEGSIVLGEAVNSHPHTLTSLLDEEHERLILPRQNHWWKKWMLDEIEQIDFLLAPSLWVKNSYVAHGFPTEKIFILPYGVDLKRFYPLSEDIEKQSSKKFKVLCVGQITPRKGQIDLLEAWKRLKLKNAELILLGSIDPLMKPILSQYKDCFTYMGFCSWDKVPYYFQQASVFVLPSIEDGFGCVISEAMASGLPVITTTNTGASDVVDEGINGYIIPIRSPEKLAEKLEILYKNQSLREEMSKNALEKARKLLNWEFYATSLIKKIYEPLFYMNKSKEKNINHSSTQKNLKLKRC